MTQKQHVTLSGEPSLEIDLFPDCSAFAILDERESTIVVAQDLPDGIDIRAFWQPPDVMTWVATKKGIRMLYEGGSDPDAVQILASAIFSSDNAVPLKEGGQGYREGVTDGY